MPRNDGEALVVAMRRVRNKPLPRWQEDPAAEPYPGDDEQWAVAAREVASLLLDLLDRQVLRP